MGATNPSEQANDIIGWCPQCGPVGSHDEDGCCLACGSTAVGDGADLAISNEALVELLRDSNRKLQAGYQALDALYAWVREGTAPWTHRSWTVDSNVDGTDLYSVELYETTCQPGDKDPRDWRCSMGRGESFTEAIREALEKANKVPRESSDA